MSALVYCRCGELKRRRTKCPECGLGREKVRPTEVRYDSRWIKLSARLRREQPLCERCRAAGRVTVSTEVHHIVSVLDAPERMYDRDNLQVLCHPCHEEIEGKPLPLNVARRHRGRRADHRGGRAIPGQGGES